MLKDVKNLPDLANNRSWLTFLVLVACGTMLLFFLGCGSDSAPKGAAGEKNAVKTGAAKTPGVLPLMTGEARTGGNLKKEPASANEEVFPGMTRQELLAKQDAARKAAESPDHEVFGGMTKAQRDAKLADEEKKVEAARKDPNRKTWGGITQAELEAKMAAEERKVEAAKQDPNRKVWGGITQAELEAKMAVEQKKIDARLLEAQAESAQKKAGAASH